MVPVRTVEYKGHRIRLFVWQAMNDKTFTAMYEVFTTDESAPHQRGTVAGALATAREAEAAALKSAQQWIDERAEGGSA